MSASIPRLDPQREQFQDPQNFGQCLLDRKGFADRLTRSVQIDHLFVSGSLVLTIDGRFGTGKTTFFNMWLKDLSERKTIMRSDKIANIVRLNAWESDYISDPLIAIVTEICKLLSKEDSTVKKQLASGLVRSGRAIKSMGGDVISAVNGAAKNMLLVDFLKAFNTAIADETAEHQDLIDLFEQKKSALKEITAILRDNARGDEGAPLLVVVDELDRCRPDYAVSYLETIKHVFDIPGVVFVIGADLAALEATVRSVFGDRLDFDSYYRKFSHRTIKLPDVTEKTSGSQLLVEKYYRKYIENNTIRQNSAIGGTDFIELVTDVVDGYGLTPREVHELFRIYLHVFSTETSGKASLFFGFHTLSVWMIAIYINDRPKFAEMRSLENWVAYAPEFIANSQLVKRTNNSEYWIRILCLSITWKGDDHQYIKTQLHRLSPAINFGDSSLNLRANYGNTHRKEILRDVLEKIWNFDTFG